MKRAMITTIVFAFGTTLATASLAQGRHDEKPHGSTKPSAEAARYAPVAMTGGRHDERPHGQRKSAPTKAEPEGFTKSAPECCK
jgi:hypothetical protein